MKQHLIISKLKLRMALLEIKVSRLAHELNDLRTEKEYVEKVLNPNPHSWSMIDSSGLYSHMECSRCFENEEVALENMDEWTKRQETEVCAAKDSK